MKAIDGKFIYTAPNTPRVRNAVIAGSLKREKGKEVSLSQEMLDNWMKVLRDKR